jgi:hypothetical protein
MLAALAVALTLFTGQPAVAHTQNQQDPFVACALKVVAGDYGEVPAWKLEAYRRGLLNNTTVKGHVWLTAYYPWEGRSGQVDCKGNPCTLRTAAANRLPYGSYIWVAEPCQMRQVLDRGAHSNDHIADRRGTSLWADLWLTRSMGTHVTEYATVGE